jgi:hypothetical protein
MEKLLTLLPAVLMGSYAAWQDAKARGLLRQVTERNAIIELHAATL